MPSLPLSFCTSGLVRSLQVLSSCRTIANSKRFFNHFTNPNYTENKENTQTHLKHKELKNGRKDQLGVKCKHLPIPPTWCCERGCHNCVWISYAEEMSEYYQDAGLKVDKAIDEHVKDENLKAFIKMEIKLQQKL